MSLRSIKVEEGSEFQQCPPGTYAARCYQIVELGLVEETYQGETKTRHKMIMSFELSELMSDGKPFIIHDWLTASLYPMSKLYKRLVSWRGKEFTQEELNGFNLENVLGAPCMIGIVHNTNGRAKVDSIAKLPQGMEAPELVNPKLFWSYGDPGRDALPEWIQKKLGRDPNPSTPQSFEETVADFDDSSIPF